jgi:hypothetical protein
MRTHGLVVGGLLLRAVLGRAGVALLSAVTLISLGAGIAATQENFRITYDVDTSTPGRTRVTGFVFNDARVDVFEVHITAEALNSAGKVVARGVAFVSPQIRQGGSAPFEAVVPARDAATYRVRVSGFRVGLGTQAP